MNPNRELINARYVFSDITKQLEQEINTNVFVHTWYKNVRIELENLNYLYSEYNTFITEKLIELIKLQTKVNKELSQINLDLYFKQQPTFIIEKEQK